MFGIILGLLSAAAYGLIPLFTLPLLASHISVETILVYRFAVAALVMTPLMVGGNYNLKIDKKEFWQLAVLSGFYLFAVIAFFHSFKYLPSSIAATIQFLYPVMVMVIMIVFFHEPFRWLIALSVILGLGGVAFLSIGADSAPNIHAGGALIWGVSLSLLAGLGNSLYMVAIQVVKLSRLNGLAITYYVMIFGTIYALANALASDSLHWIENWEDIFMAVSLALVTAVFSNLALVLAIQRIGSTLSAILGVMEPLTAVAVGVTVFNEPFTTVLALGIVLIASSVFVAILAPKSISTK